MLQQRILSMLKARRSGAGEARVLQWDRRRHSMTCIPEVPVTSISVTNKQSTHPLTCFKRIPKTAERTDEARAMNHGPFRTTADIGVD
jgi:hypothetical protein